MNALLITSLLLALGGVGYSAWRIATIAPMPMPLRWGLAIIWIACFALLVINFVLRSNSSMETLRYTYPIATSWIFYLLYAVMIFLAIDLLRLIPALRPILAPSWTLASVVWIVFIGIFSYGSYRYYHKERVPLNIQLEKPLLSKPLKIIAISDMHLGYTIGKKELLSWVKIINSEKPDLVLIAGDIVDGDVRPVLADGLAEAFNQIQAPIYACLGNHEYLGTEATHKSFIHQTKIQLLQDSVALFNNELYIIGRDDETNTERKSLKQLVQGLDHTKPIILLDHQPHDLRQAEENGIDLQLSGHTHRGQVFPINLIVDRMYEQSHGYLRKGKTQYYVSSGIGIWGGKYRIGTQSEYAVITLQGK